MSIILYVYVISIAILENSCLQILLNLLSTLILGSQQLDVNFLVLNYVNKCFEIRAIHQE